MSGGEGWRHYLDEVPIMAPEALVELHRFGPSPWPKPQIMRRGDIPPWLNAYGLYWRIPI